MYSHSETRNAVIADLNKALCDTYKELDELDRELINMEDDVKQFDPQDLAKLGLDKALIDTFNKACGSGRNEIAAYKKGTLDPMMANLKQRKLPGRIKLSDPKYQGNFREDLDEKERAPMNAVKKFVDQARDINDKVILARKKFMEAFEKKAAIVKEKEAEFDKIIERFSAVRSKGYEDQPLSAEISKGGRLRDELERIQEQAKDADAYERTADEFNAVVDAAEKLLAVAEAEAERLEKEKVAREAAMEKLAGVSATITKAQSDQRVEALIGVDITLPDTTELLGQVAHIRAEAPGMKLDELEKRVDTFVQETTALLSKIQDEMNMGKQKSKALFAQRLSMFSNAGGAVPQVEAPVQPKPSITGGYPHRTA